MFKWFMAKSLITKIIIVISSVVVIGGTTAGIIIVPKVIEQQQQEQLEREQQEQLQKEKEEDLANMSLVIKEDLKNGINLPLNMVVQGVKPVRYNEIEKVFSFTDDTNYKEELKKGLIKELVESYSGGELTVEENIDIHKKGDYPVKFILTSEKGNTKTETVKVTVWNYYRVKIYMESGTENITVEKGKQVDVMNGVNFDSNLPKEEQGHIETEGTVDVNKVGTYKITYKYIPKDENEVPISEETRTYKVVDTLSVNGKVYKLTTEGYLGSLSFEGKKFTLSKGAINSGGDTYKGTYTVNGNNITLNVTYSANEGGEGTDNFELNGTISNNGKTITIKDLIREPLTFSLN